MAHNPGCDQIPQREARIIIEPERSGPGEKMVLKYAVIFERADNNWAAYVPDLPGCITTGETLEETEQNIHEASEGHLETLRESSHPIQPSTTVARNIEVQAARV